MVRRAMLSVGLVSALFAATPARAQLALNDGDTVVFLGNGVTQQHQFSWMVEAFLRIRYPEHKIHFLNAGAAGDTADKCLERLKDEVLPLKPTVAVVSFGLYEGGFSAWAPKTFEKFQTDLRKLLDALAAAKVRVILCSPTPVDADRPFQGRSLKGYNQVLEKYGEFCRQEALKRKLPFADVFHPVLAAEAKGGASKPKWTAFHDKDSILLSPAGHAVVAERLLRSLAAHEQAFRIVGERKGEEIVYHDLRGEKEKGPDQTAKWAADGITMLTLRHIRRPVPLFRFPKTPGAEQVAAIVPAAQAMNEIQLRLGGLPSGHYQLRLDGRPLGTYSHADLLRGVSLISGAPAEAAPLLDSHLERLWAGILLKDHLHQRRMDPAVRKDKAKRERVGAEFDRVVAGLDELNRRLVEPLRLAILPGAPVPDGKAPPAAKLVAGKTVRCLNGGRYYDIVIPADFAPDGGPYPMLVWLHSDGEAPEQWEQHFRKLADAHKCVVVLPKSWDAGWRVDADAKFLIEQIVKIAGPALRAAPQRVILGGHNSGADVAVDTVLTNASAVHGLLAVSGAYPRPPTPVNGRHGAASFIQGTNNRKSFQQTEALKAALDKLGWKTELRSHDKGEQLPAGALDEAIKFLLANLP